MEVSGIIKSAVLKLEHSQRVSFGAHMVEFALGLEYYAGLPGSVERKIASAGKESGLTFLKRGPRSYTFTKQESIEELIRDGHYRKDQIID